MKKKVIFIVLFIVLLLGVLVWFMTSSLPYPIPSGEYKVGTVILDIEDSTRNEWALPEKEQNRRFVVRIWYPANPVGNESMLPIMEKEYAKGMSELYGFPQGKEKPSQSYQNAPVKINFEKYPILIFTHGGGSFMTQNLTTFEELASHGYVVMSISFPYESVSTVFPDGEVVSMKGLQAYKESMAKLVKDKEFATEFAANIEKMKDPSAEIANEASISLGNKYNELYPDMETWLDTRVNDISYLINNLDSVLVQGQQLTSFADSDNIGLFGHSFGGLTTLQYLMNYSNPQVKCGIALDVPYFNMHGESDVSLKAPVLLMSSDFIKIAGNKVELGGVNGFLKHYTSQTIYECNVKGAAHYNFTDMNYLPKFMKLTPLLGSISQEEAIKIMDYYLKSYFGYHLKGKPKSMVKAKISEEVIFSEVH